MTLKDRIIYIYICDQIINCEKCMDQNIKNQQKYTLNKQTAICECMNSVSSFCMMYCKMLILEQDNNNKEDLMFFVFVLLYLLFLLNFKVFTFFFLLIF